MSLQRAGFRADVEWRVYAEFTPVFSLVQEPWNSVVALLRERHLQASMTEAASRRDTLRGQVDWHLNAQLPRGWDRPKLGLLKALQAGGVWSDYMDFKSGFKSTAACSHCQNPKGDLMHLLWCCPVFEHCGTEVR
eukprot:14785326-Alexandrium_andersonii.AAC.1